MNQFQNLGNNGTLVNKRHVRWHEIFFKENLLNAEKCF